LDFKISTGVLLLTHEFRPVPSKHDGVGLSKEKKGLKRLPLFFKKILPESGHQNDMESETQSHKRTKRQDDEDDHEQKQRGINQQAQELRHNRICQIQDFIDENDKQEDGQTSKSLDSVVPLFQMPEKGVVGKIVSSTQTRKQEDQVKASTEEPFAVHNDAPQSLLSSAVEPESQVKRPYAILSDDHIIEVPNGQSSRYDCPIDEESGWPNDVAEPPRSSSVETNDSVSEQAVIGEGVLRPTLSSITRAHQPAAPQPAASNTSKDIGEKGLASIETVEKVIGYTFQDKHIIWEALQARGTGLKASGGREFSDGNKRLAMWGDNVLDSIFIKHGYESGLERGT
jgi:hypothetical protein